MTRLWCKKRRCMSAYENHTLPGGPWRNNATEGSVANRAWNLCLAVTFGNTVLQRHIYSNVLNFLGQFLFSVKEWNLTTTVSPVSMAVSNSKRRSYYVEIPEICWQQFTFFFEDILLICCCKEENFNNPQVNDVAAMPANF